MSRKRGRGGEVFTAECLLKSRGSKNKKEYFVKWAGYTSEFNTWEPASNILDHFLINEFEQRDREEKAAKRRVKLEQPAATCSKKREHSPLSTDGGSSEKKKVMKEGGKEDEVSLGAEVVANDSGLEVVKGDLESDGKTKSETESEVKQEMLDVIKEIQIEPTSVPSELDAASEILIETPDIEVIGILADPESADEADSLIIEDDTNTSVTGILADPDSADEADSLIIEDDANTSVTGILADPESADEADSLNVEENAKAPEASATNAEKSPPKPDENVTMKVVDEAAQNEPNTSPVADEAGNAKEEEISPETKQVVENNTLEDGDKTYDDHIDRAADMWIDRLKRYKEDLERSKMSKVKYPFRLERKEASDDGGDVPTYFAVPNAAGEIFQFGMHSQLKYLMKAAGEESE